jgi:hypothetical protein
MLLPIYVAIAGLVAALALALVVIIGHPDNPVRLLAWGLIALGAAFTVMVAARR